VNFTRFSKKYPLLQIKVSSIALTSARILERLYFILDQTISGNFVKVKSKSATKYFLKDNAPYDVGDLFIQNDLENVLSEIAENDPRSFLSRYYC